MWQITLHTQTPIKIADDKAYKIVVKAEKSPISAIVVENAIIERRGIQEFCGLFVTVYGEAASEDEAVHNLAKHGEHFSSILSLVFNTSAKTAVIRTIRDLGDKKYRFTQKVIVGKNLFPPPAIREISLSDDDFSLIVKAMETLNSYTKASYAYLGRSVGAYSEALRHWSGFENIKRGEFLWICAENLKNHLRSELCSDYGVRSDYDLARKLGLTKGLGPNKLEELFANYLVHKTKFGKFLRFSKNEKSRLDNYIYEQLVFKGETKKYRLLKNLSEGFEHGFVDYAQIHEISNDEIVEVSQIIRASLLEKIGTGVSKKFGTKYSEPMSDWPPIYTLSGELGIKTGDGDPSKEYFYGFIENTSFCRKNLNKRDMELNLEYNGFAGGDNLVINSFAHGKIEVPGTRKTKLKSITSSNLKVNGKIVSKSRPYRPSQQNL